MYEPTMEEVHAEWIARLYHCEVSGNNEGVKMILAEISDFYDICETTVTH